MNRGQEHPCQNHYSGRVPRAYGYYEMGRKRVKVSTQHVDPLSTQWLSNNPGLLNAVRAVTSYRTALQDRVPPQTAFVDLSWLETPAN